MTRKTTVRWFWTTVATVMLVTANARAVTQVEIPDEIRRDATVRAVERVMPCVVNVATETLVDTRTAEDEFFEQFFAYRRRPPEKRYSVGSGVIIDEEGYILTNDHVVSRATRIWIKLSEEAGGGEYEADRIVSTQRSDVALLKIRAKAGEKFKAVEFARDDDLLLGETVIALGNPFGLGGSVSRGILSSKSRRAYNENQPMDIPDWLQTDAAINPGNSGGALINLKGELIGLNVAVLQQGQGIGFAIPIKRVGEALSEQLTPETLRSLWFGARVKPGAVPLVVGNVQKESPAYLAGLREGDIILKINDKTARSFIDYTRELLNATAAKPVSLLVRQQDQIKEITVTLVPESSYFNADLVQTRTGLTLQPLTKEQLQGQRFIYGGFVISGIESGSPGDKAGLKPYYLIQGVDGQLVTDMITLARLIHSKPKGETIKLSLLVPMRSGYFQSGTTELTLR